VPRYKELHLTKDPITKLLGIISLPIVKLLSYTPITPNQVTSFSLVIWLVACVFIAVSNPIVGAILLYVFGVLDAADGTLARYKNMTSSKGKYIEAISHSIAEPFLMAAVAFNVYSKMQNPLILLVGFVAVISRPLNEIFYIKKIQMFVEDKKFFDVKKSAGAQNNKNTSFFKRFEPLLYFTTSNFLYHLTFICAIFDIFVLELLYFAAVHFIFASLRLFIELRRDDSWVGGLFNK
jgi:hypothetical protein